MTRRDELSNAVDKGIEALDVGFGREHWLESIDLDVLDMGHPCKCILGQHSGSTYSVGQRELQDILNESDDTNDEHHYRVGDGVWYQPEEYGFDGREGEHNADYPILTELWREKIKGLREGGE